MDEEELVVVVDGDCEANEIVYLEDEKDEPDVVVASEGEGDEVEGNEIDSVVMVVDNEGDERIVVVDDKGKEVDVAESKREVNEMK